MRAFCFKVCHPTVWGIVVGVSLWAGLRLSAAGKQDVSDELFTNAAIRHVRIEISNEGMDTLRRYTWQNRGKLPRTSVPAILREWQIVWTNVAVHLKGAYVSFRP